jgi:hypothetical protein
MSNQRTITVLLANRPRLFRELLQHALKTESPQIRVVEAADGMPSSAQLREADWLVVDEESTNGAMRMASANPKLGILALEGRGSRARVLAPAAQGTWQSLSDIPTLSELFTLLSQEAVQYAN